MVKNKCKKQNKNKQRHWDHLLLCIKSIWDERRSCASADRQVNIHLVNFLLTHISLVSINRIAYIDRVYHIIKNMYKESQDHSQQEPRQKSHQVRIHTQAAHSSQNSPCLFFSQHNAPKLVTQRFG